MGKKKSPSNFKYICYCTVVSYHKRSSCFRAWQILNLLFFFFANSVHFVQRFPHFLHSWNLTPATTDLGLYIRRQKTNSGIASNLSDQRWKKNIKKKKKELFMTALKTQQCCSDGARHQHLIKKKKKKKHLGWLQNSHQKVIQYINRLSHG